MKNNYPQFNAIIIGTKDISRAKIFYKNVFGITVIEEKENYLSAKTANNIHLELEENSEHRFPNWESNNIGSYKNTQFEVNDIFKFIQTVKENGGKVISEPKKRPWGTYGAEISDLDENIFLITQQ